MVPDAVSWSYLPQMRPTDTIPGRRGESVSYDTTTDEAAAD